MASGAGILGLFAAGDRRLRYPWLVSPGKTAPFGLPGFEPRQFPFSVADRAVEVKMVSPAGLQHALGGRHAGHARIDLDGLAECPSGGFEDRFDDVMRVAAVMTEDVQVESPLGRK